MWFYWFLLFIERSVVIALLVFFNDTATTEIYTYLHTLSLHDALPISCWHAWAWPVWRMPTHWPTSRRAVRWSRKSTRLTPVTNAHLVCRLLLEKKKKQHLKTIHSSYITHQIHMEI